MKITVISGSNREQAQSLKVAGYIQRTLEAGICDKAGLVSLANNPLPLWDMGVWEGGEKWTELLAPIREELASSDAFVVITPEWHGQVPAGLKNFFLLFGRIELGHKPALIVSVSSRRRRRLSGGGTAHEQLQEQPAVLHPRACHRAQCRTGPQRGWHGKQCRLRQLLPRPHSLGA